MQLDSDLNLRRRQFVFPVAIIVAAIGLYVWGVRVESENERLLHEQVRQFVKALNDPDRAAKMLQGEAMVIDSLIPQLPAPPANATDPAFTIQEKPDSKTGATHLLTIQISGAAHFELHLVHPGPTSRLDVVGFQILP